MYYLKKLLKEKLVTKSPEGIYELSVSGKRYADSLSLTNLQPRIQPKIVTLIIATNKAGEQLLYVRKKQPFINMVGFPYGKIHLGETVKEAASRELTEKTGLSGRLTHVGDAYITAYDNADLVSQMLAHVFTIKNPTGNLIAKSAIGECYWGKLADIPRSQTLPANLGILKLASKASEHFFTEFTIDLASR